MANFQNIKALTLEKEGGLSNATTDYASRNPSPYIHNGVSGWHTNKGVTYTTFVEASKKFGFENNENNFINMPDSIWDKIAKGMFWDSLNLDKLKSDGVAFQLFSWKWGAGSGWYSRMKNYLNSKGIDWDKSSATLYIAVNQLIDKQGEKKTIDDLQAEQIAFYESLNQPANIKGWINRVVDTTKYAYRYIQGVTYKHQEIVNYGLWGVIIIGVSGLTYWYYKKKLKK